jgi:hypothetical protein
MGLHPNDLIKSNHFPNVPPFNTIEVSTLLNTSQWGLNFSTWILAGIPMPSCGWRWQLSTAHSIKSHATFPHFFWDRGQPVLVSQCRWQGSTVEFRTWWAIYLFLHIWHSGIIVTSLTGYRSRTIVPASQKALWCKYAPSPSELCICTHPSTAVSCSETRRNLSKSPRVRNLTNPKEEGLAWKALFWSQKRAIQ